MADCKLLHALLLHSRPHPDDCADRVLSSRRTRLRSPARPSLACRASSSSLDTQRCFVFGFGYTTLALAKCLLAASWHVSGACSSSEKADALRVAGVDAHLWAPDDGVGLDQAGLDALRRATHVLSSVPPVGDHSVDPVLQLHASELHSQRWIAYLSSTSVYGDAGGDWVDEESPLRARPEDVKAWPRVQAEAAWLRLQSPVHVFRLGGIYGPGRSVLPALLNSRSESASQRGRDGKRWTSRCHVDDIVSVLLASMAKPAIGSRLYNVCDDNPAPRSEVVTFASRLLSKSGVAEEPNNDAAQQTAPRRSGEKRVCNQRIKDELGIRLRYPSYREGYRAMIDALQPSST